MVRLFIQLIYHYLLIDYKKEKILLEHLHKQSTAFTSMLCINIRLVFIHRASPRIKEIAISYTKTKHYLP